MKRLSMLEKLTFSFFLFMIAFFSLGLSPDPNSLKDSVEATKCDFPARLLCYHNFDNSFDSDTADSPTYSVVGCATMTYRHYATGGSDVEILECPTSTRTADCSIFTGDVNSDGRITETDENSTLNGVIGRRGHKALPPGGPYHLVNVLQPPSSGVARVTGMCTPRK